MKRRLCRTIFAAPDNFLPETGRSWQRSLPSCARGQPELTGLNPLNIVRASCIDHRAEGGKALENSTIVLLAETCLRVILGWRMLISGLSNVRRWPNPVNTASLLFPKGATFFGFVATFLMVVGGFGLAVGLQTSLCALMIIIFLVPTFALHWHWLKVLPTMAPVVRPVSRMKKRKIFVLRLNPSRMKWAAITVFVAAAIYFTVRGSAAFGVDSWLGTWVIKFF
jgi:uncharacterized membrane protein YphA (DoxX/SURF4 family)